MTIFDYFKASVIEVFYNDRNLAENREPFAMERFFPNRKQLGLDLSWIKAHSSVPVMLNQSNFDADPLYRDFGGFEKQSTELAFFREGYLLKEKDRQELMRIMGSSNLAGLETLLATIYNEIADLVLSASVTREVMRWDLVLNGSIKMASNGVSLNYDYQIPTNQYITTSVDWSTSTTATPFQDLLDAIESAEERHGETIKYVYMNAKDFNKLVKAKSTADLWKNNMWGVPTKTDVKQRLQMYDDKDFEIIIYKKRYAKKKGQTPQEYLPEGKVLILPDVRLGNTVFGTTPEEADLLYSQVANVSIVDTGVAITSITHPTPVKLETIVSQVVLPSLEGAEYITVLNTIKK